MAEKGTDKANLRESTVKCFFTVTKIFKDFSEMPKFSHQESR